MKEAARRVLLVEDELALSRLVKRVLSEEGYEVRTEFNGRAGLGAALSDPPDAIILDLGLPDLDGLAVCRELRSQGVRAPVIMLTARDSVGDRVAGLDAGADDYVVKPFAFEELLARLRAQLRREAGDGERLEARGVVLKPATREVSVDGSELELTDKEFRLLELLMRHKGQVLTRQRILDHVWGYASTPQSNVVEIYVHYLRHKLAPDGRQDRIRTVRGVGYAFRA